MPKKAAGPATAQRRYWEKRIRSRQFTRALTELAVRELRALARERIRDVVDAELVRTLIDELDTRVIDRAIVADLVVAGNRRIGARLARGKQSLLDLLDRRLVADIAATLEGETALSPRAQEFVSSLMRREFVGSLLADVIYTAFVSFQGRVNPLFGAFATRALENQIKGFIRLVMPMLQAQATAFAVDRRNQRIALDFAAAVARQLLEVPLARYAAMAASGGGKTAEVLIRKAVKNTQLSALTRQAARAVWDDLYGAIRSKRVGDLLRLEEHADWLAARCVEVIRPALARPHVLRFIAAEMALAGAAAPTRR